MAATGNGSSITLAGGAVGTVTGLSGIGGTRDSIDTSNLATTGGRTFIPGDLVDYGELSVEGHWNGTAPQITGSSTGAYSISIGTTAGAKTWAGSGFITSWQTDTPLDDLVSFSLTIKATGTWTLS
tara:strand:+ start:2255 stop:2632 length:378 start_codon:yes stop_codon:yes gene_type:complete